MADSYLWWREGVVYQIYPRSFADSDNDGLGDLPGIVGRLDYLAALGIDAVWLSPIYPSPDIDFGYDVSDYQAIDPRFGSLADFDRLVEEAHRRNIRVILDLVLNHTSDRHPWFQQSRASLDNPYRDWYLWREGKGGNPPNNWQSIIGGRGWELDPATGEYYFHMYYKQQPDVNWRNPKVRQAMLDVVSFWLERGVDGFRLDVFNLYYKHPAFPDNPAQVGIRGFDRQKHIYDTDQPEMHAFLADLRALLDQYPERYAVGETFLATPEKAASYCGADQLHAAFNFAFTETRWNPAQLLKSIHTWERCLGPQNWPNYVLNNHDLPRTATRIFHNRGEESLKVAAALLLSLRGTPFLYYGEEIGMKDIALSRDQILDPVGKKYWPFYKGRDGCRSPMQWDATAHAGFTQGSPWLPLHPEYPNRNVAAQQSDPDSLLNFYRQLIRVRRNQPALQSGRFAPLRGGDRDTLVYLRQQGEQICLVGLNFSHHPQIVGLSGELIRRDWSLLLSNGRSVPPDLSSGALNLKPNEAVILCSEDRRTRLIS